MNLTGAVLMSVGLAAGGVAASTTPAHADGPVIGSLGDFYGCTATFTLDGDAATLTAKADRPGDCHGSIAFYIPGVGSQYPETLYGPATPANLPGVTVVEPPRLCDVEVDFFSQPAVAPETLANQYSDTSLAWILIGEQCVPTTTTTTVISSTTRLPTPTRTTVSTTTPPTVPSTTSPPPTSLAPSPSTSTPSTSATTRPISTTGPTTTSTSGFTTTTVIASPGVASLPDTGAPTHWLYYFAGLLIVVGGGLLGMEWETERRARR